MKWLFLFTLEEFVAYSLYQGEDILGVKLDFEPIELKFGM